MTYLLVFFTCLILSLLITPYFIKFINKHSMIEGSWDNKQLPNLGGLLIYLIVLLMINSFSHEFDSVKSIIISSAILVFSGVVDSLIKINRYLKFVIHNIAGLILILHIDKYFNSVLFFGFPISSPYDTFIF